VIGYPEVITTLLAGADLGLISSRLIGKTTLLEKHEIFKNDPVE